MRRAALAAALLGLLLAGGASPARALFGGDSEQKALLWVPDQREIDWDAFLALMLRYPDARLTVALIPAQIPEEAWPWLQEMDESGRLEVALRIGGDPILPLIYKHRDRDVIDRVALGRVDYRKIFDRYPAGLVPGDGALIPELATPLERQGLKWAAVGEGMFRSPWYSPGDMVLIPFHVPESTHPSSLASIRDSRAVVLSEPDWIIEPGSGLDVLERLFRSESPKDWTTVSAALKEMSPYAVGPGVWPPWSGAIEIWTSEDELQERAWDLYGRTVRALLRYQNSGSAKLFTLNKASRRLYRAQDSEFYRAGNLRSRAMDREFRKRLRRVYKIIGKRPPRLLSIPVASARRAHLEEPEDDDEPLEPAQGGPDGDDGIKGRIDSGTEGAMLWFKNPEKSISGVPEPLPELPPGVTAQHLWSLGSLRADWDDQAVTFTFKLQALHENAEAAHGFGSVLLDLYMDLNHLDGRGSTVLLPGRRGFVPSPDAWEYALVVSGWAGGLYRSQPGQQPGLVAKLQPKAFTKTGEIQVSVPRSKLRGNPAGWGYLLLGLGTDAERALKIPPTPLPGKDGGPVLGLLGPLEYQKKHLKAGPGGYNRYSVLRLED